MKKIFIVMVITLLITVTGCTASKEDTSENESIKVVYCDKCGEESKEVTKFCSNCGKEAKWLAEQPETLDINKEDI